MQVEIMQEVWSAISSQIENIVLTITTQVKTAIQGVIDQLIPITTPKPYIET